MLRLDRYLANLGIAPRRQIGIFMKAYDVFINDELIKRSDVKVKYGDVIRFGETEIDVVRNVTILLHKPAGYICSDIDEKHPSYQNLLSDCPYRDLLHVAGRLDVDTEGLVVATSDGDLNHSIISPKKEIDKEYEVHCDFPISEESCELLRKGVDIDNYTTLPAKVLKQSDLIILLTIKEGKFHQVKKMLEAVGNSVKYLKRTRVGEWTLDGLKKGEWKYLLKD